MQWADVKDIDDTKPVDEDDKECLYELRDVLKRYGMQDRFGVALLHSHLDISDDEVFLEECDEENRVLHLRPTKIETASNAVNVGTIFHLKDGDFNTASWCRTYCQRPVFAPFDGHSKGHNVED